ncbi:MAG: phosphoenolpyruvate carboxylase [Pseudohongiellaceae bacterium]|nr:phosphoenolpyruvate carboxylase [Pseudohongiellaceae bacterium]
MIEQVSKPFAELVELNFQLYNSLFLTLPLDAVEQTGTLLPLLDEACASGLEQGKNPAQIIQNFFEVHKPQFNEEEQIQFLFKIIQYVERQVVLIDALEDAAYSKIHRIEGKSKLLQLVDRAKDEDKGSELAKLLENFGVRVVLTAHPTQFYTGPVLAIISDLTQAISNNETAVARDLLQQLGNTPFYQQNKPSPYEEAVLLTWYLGNIFYPGIGEIVDQLAEHHPEQVTRNKELISIGFWPGGDRDGNPFVTVDTTLKVAEKLRYTVFNCYHKNIRDLKRRLSFRGTYKRLEDLERAIHQEMTLAQTDTPLSIEHMLSELDAIEVVLLENFQGLHVEKLRSFRRKVRLFGFHFASIDIRQDSRVIASAFDAIIEKHPELLPANYAELDREGQMDALLRCEGNVDAEDFDDPIVKDTIASFSVIGQIQQRNGERAAHRYIISNCRGALDMAKVYGLFKLCGWKGRELSVDIVPLFETVEDLQSAGESMGQIYAHECYKAHLNGRKERQTVMLGFSDGTKDGGYLMANWAIYSAKEDLTAISRRSGIEVIFFDGRGGPPARGGGDTYMFYAAMGRNIESSQIQMTVQGQTISTLYGIKAAANHNLSQLLTAGLENSLIERADRELADEQRELLVTLAQKSYQVYDDFKNSELFLPYLEEMSTLKYYAMTNIGSRPAKRGATSKLKFEDLRAIPFVGAWAQLKQNVPGFYGLGSALKEQDEKGNFDACIALYQRSRFFRALISNSMQSMCKTNFQLTQYMESDPRFGEFWKSLHKEFELSSEMVLRISGQEKLLEDNPRSRMSIQLREKVVLPLLTVQQYALMQIQQARTEDDTEYLELYEKMVMRSLFGNINASRNSA